MSLGDGGETLVIVAGEDLFEVQQDGKIGMSSVSWAREEVEAVYAKYAVSEAKTAPLFAAKENVAEFRAG